MVRNREIKQALRKILIANEIADRMVICVTGLQGTGKTTLIKNYYDIDDSMMNIALGRGERLPVFITEADVTIAQMYAVGIEKDNYGYHERKNAVSSKEFVEFSKAENEDSTIMYMELIVPRKYLPRSSKVSFMLLPGYERKNSYWNTLIEFSVQSADTAVFVMTPESVADANNAQLLEKIKQTFGDNLIYVITQSDLKADDNAETKKTLMDKVGVDESQSGRFVCTGAYVDKKKNEKWKKSFQTAIEIYSADLRSADEKNTEYIEKIIAEDLNPAVVEIKKYMTDVTEEILTGLEHSSWLDAFDKADSNMRKWLKKSLEENFNVAKSKDVKDLLDVLQHGRKQSENSTNLGNIISGGKAKASYLRRSIWGESLKDIDEAKKLIDEVMHDNNNQYRYEIAFTKSIATTTDQLCSNTTEDNALQIGGFSSKHTILSEKENYEKKQIIQDVTTILKPENNNNELVSKKPTEIMRAIVEIGTQYFGLNVVNALYSEQYITVPELAESHLSKEDIAMSIKDSKKFLMTILGITSLDLLGDGVINFIPSLAKAVGIANPAAGAIVAGVTGLGVVKSILSDYNKMQIKDYYTYEKAIDYVYDEIKERYLDIYDDYFARVRERVETFLIDCAGANDAVINKQNALIAIKNIQSDLKVIRKEIKDDSYDPTKLIRG
jgi:signal recognition particle receptor subunit beta